MGRARGVQKVLRTRFGNLLVGARKTTHFFKCRREEDAVGR